LSALRFIFHILRIHKDKQQHTTTRGENVAKHHLICDNKALVNKVKEIIKYKTIYPNTTVASEWDVLAEIRATLITFPEDLRPSINHIKGHQDKTTPFSKLPLLAQLNCRADWLADEFLLKHPQLNHSTVPIMPTSGCQLHLSHGTVTHHIKRELKHARTAPPLKKYMMDKYAWEEEHFNEVNWQNHGRALRRLEKHRKTLVQYLHDWTPVGTKVHQYDVKYPASCPSCQAPVEDRDHLLYCPAPCRDKWRNECYSTMLQTLNKLDTCPQVQELFLSALRVVLDNHDTASIRVEPAVASIGRAQADIGWHHILKGRLSKQWGKAQAKYLGSRADTKNNGDTWMTKVIEVMLREWLKLWKLRNEDRHGSNRHTRRQAEERQAIRELQQFYDAHDGRVPSRLQWLFDTPISEKMAWTVGNIRLWLNAWKPVVEKSYTTDLETG
jgi:hypothetical protein